MLSLSLSLFLRLCAINTPWHTRERASERAFEKNVARGKGDGAFQNFEITPNSFSFVVFFCVTCTRLSFLSQVLFGFLHAQTKKKNKDDESAGRFTAVELVKFYWLIVIALSPPDCVLHIFRARAKNAFHLRREVYLASKLRPRIETHIETYESMEEEKNVKSAWTIEVRLDCLIFVLVSETRAQQPSPEANFFKRFARAHGAARSKFAKRV